MTKWIDITQPLSNDIAHWPGDEPFSYETTVTKAQSGPVNIGKITTSTHIGTHVDAPFHFLNDGKRIIEMDIERYIGICKVVVVSEYPDINEHVIRTVLPDLYCSYLITITFQNTKIRHSTEVVS